MTRRSESWNGSVVNAAVLAPMPSTRASSAIVVDPAFARRTRNPKVKSFQRASIVVTAVQLLFQGKPLANSGIGWIVVRLWDGGGRGWEGVRCQLSGVSIF